MNVVSLNYTRLVFCKSCLHYTFYLILAICKRLQIYFVPVDRLFVYHGANRLVVYHGVGVPLRTTLKKLIRRYTNYYIQWQKKKNDV